MSNTVRIWVDPLADGRVAGWVVRCEACAAGKFLPQRTKGLAIEVANLHSRVVHGGRCVLGVKK